MSGIVLRTGLGALITTEPFKETAARAVQEIGTMVLIKPKRVAYVLLICGVGGLAALAQSVRAQEKRAVLNAKLDLTPESFGKLHALIRPHQDEWRHLKVEWLTDVVAARKKAAAEDRPIVICYTGGAGYNEPLGVC
jgi:hypothetical protein